MKIDDLIKQSQSLQAGRSNFENEWQKVADIFRPVRSNITTVRSEGDKSHIHRLFDSYPINALNTLKSIIIGVFFNRSIQPITIISDSEEVNDDQEASEWLTDFTEYLLKEMFNPKTGFERALSEAVSDDIAFGTFATFIERGLNSTLKYHTLHINNFLIAESKDGDVDYVIMKSKKTTRQILQEWGENGNIHENILKTAEKEPFKEWNFELHIMPRKERDEKKIDKLNKKIAGYWIDVDNKRIVEETGWDSMPVAVGRSEKASNELYGTSRAMMAMASAYQSNEMWRQLNEATELALRPPLNVNANYAKRINLKAGALNYPELKAGNTRAAIEPINVVGSIAANKDLILELKQTINDIFFIDKLKIFDNPNATATQVLELRAEGFRIMGDFVTGLIEYMDAILQRSFDLLFNANYDENGNLFPDAKFKKPLPKLLLQNPDLKIEYINPIAQSQKLNESSTIDKWLQDIANIAQFKPEALDLLNVDEVIRNKRQIFNIDPELINSKAKVEETRQQRAQQQQQQMELMQEEQAVNIASQAKKSNLI